MSDQYNNLAVSELAQTHDIYPDALIILSKEESANKIKSYRLSCCELCARFDEHNVSAHINPLSNEISWLSGYVDSDLSTKTELANEFASQYYKTETSSASELANKFSKYYQQTETSSKTQLTNAFNDRYLKSATSSATELKLEFGSLSTNAQIQAADNKAREDAIRISDSHLNTCSALIYRKTETSSAIELSNKFDTKSDDGHTHNDLRFTVSPTYSIGTVVATITVGSTPIQIKIPGFNPPLFATQWLDYYDTSLTGSLADGSAGGWMPNVGANLISLVWYSATDFPEAYGKLVTAKTAGREYDITSYNAKYTKCTNGWRIVDEKYIDVINSMYTSTGTAWYYMLGTDKFALPRTKYGFNGVRSAVGNTIAQSLPEIQGTFTADNTQIGTSYEGSSRGPTGAFVGQYTGGFDIHSSGRGSGGRLLFSAAHYDSTYKVGAPVQPPATEMYLYMFLK